MSEDLISSLYPPPPPYYKFFTKENLDRFQQWRSSPSSTDIPAELRLQIPPEIPTSDQYRGYGSIWSLKNELPSLKESGWSQLYQEGDETITSKAKIEELHKLLDSLLLNFLELVASVSVEPAKFYVKIEHLKSILINMNHLLNTYRPHQTRESLIMLLQSQIDSKKAEIAGIERVTGEVKAKILALVSDSNSDADMEAAYNEASSEEKSSQDTSSREERLQVLKKLLLENTN